MENIRLFQFKNIFLNRFFWQNNILFVKVKNSPCKISYTETLIANVKWLVVLVDNDFKNFKQEDDFVTFVFEMIDQLNFADYFYTDMRLDFKDSSFLFLSQIMDLKLEKLDDKIKNSFLVYHYFKVKDLIKRQGFDLFYEQYKMAGVNEMIDQCVKRAKGGLEDYFYICTLKNIIRIYKKEVDHKIDYYNPSFSEKMLFKYFDNYFSKVAVISYDRSKVKCFISKYYVTDVQSEDQLDDFITNFLLFYKFVTNNHFLYESNYNPILKNMCLFHANQSKNIKCSNFYKYFDHVVKNEDNFKSFMFILETLELKQFLSNRKKILSYISVFELLLVNGDKFISLQLQRKLGKYQKKEKYSFEEIKLAYDYRSKINHGEYKEASFKLHQLSLMDSYKFSKEELDYEVYLNFEQMIERRLCERLRCLLRIILRYFIFYNQSLKNMKNERISNENL